ncbi:hypothetical protein FOCC_FOCC015803, partial [Frankliniella occidentalis]
MNGIAQATSSIDGVRESTFSNHGVLQVTGLVLLSIGAAIKAAYYGYHVFLDDAYFSAPNLLIAVGLIILLVSFLGCCGAVKENHCMIVSYIALLILIFILELSGGIAGYVCRDKVEEVLKEKLTESMINYGDPKDPVTKLWNTIQSKFECCGAESYKDWLKPPVAKTTNATNVPVSCCPLPSGYGPFYCNATSDPSMYLHGCTEKFGEFVRDKAVVIGSTGITIALIQYIALLILIFILELSGGIAGYVCRDKVEEVLKEKLTESMINYGDPKDPVTKLWNTIQSKFECCGAESYKDWLKPPVAKTTNATNVPVSCCPLPSGYGPFYCNATSDPSMYLHGCTEKFGEFVRDKAVVIGSTGITIALIQ